jgi:hypothetical protein
MKQVECNLINCNLTCNERNTLQDALSEYALKQFGCNEEMGIEEIEFNAMVEKLGLDPADLM